MIKKYALSILFTIAFQCTLFSQQNNSDQLIKKINDRDYPQWFTQAKLGIFIHWGLYSVPAYGSKEDYSEWFLRGIQTGDTLRTNFMKKTYGQNFTYKDFASIWKAELFNPDEWASLFQRAGAKYVVLVSKHHDGYTLWPSKYNRNWNSVDTGPKRDIVGELTEAVRKTDLKMGLYYSLSEWNHPLHRWYTDPHDSIGKYVDTYMIPQFKELVSTYKPSLIFADGEWFNSAEQWHSAELINWYYDLVGKEAIVNDRWGSGIKVGFLTPEYSAGIKVTDRPWTEVRGIGRSFGLNRNETLEAYGTSKELIERFVQAVANGGGMILNVGPNADGQIPMIQQERLLQLGNWLDINGEAIYGSQPYMIKEQEKQITKSRIDQNINFNWVRNAPIKGIKEDDFTAEWNGFISVPTSGKYTLEIKADDEAKVFLDKNLILSNKATATGSQSEVMGADHTVQSNHTITLKKGKRYAIRMLYEEKKQNASVSLSWESNSLKKEVIPSSAFYIEKNGNQHGLKATYSSQKTYLCYTKNKGNIYAISFEWPEEKLVLDIENPGNDKKIHLLGLSRDLPWIYKNNQLIIDTSSIKYSELPSHDAWTFKIGNINSN